MRKDNTVYLHHMLDAIERIETYLQGIAVEQFLANMLLQDGIVRQLEIIGEAAHHLPDDLRRQHSDVPWSAIIGMRNRIIHEYFNVNLTIVWEVTQNDLPPLKAYIHRMLAI